MTYTKRDLLTTPVEHIDIKQFPVNHLVAAMGKTAFQGRNLARAAEIYQMMINDKDCSIILCLAGSLISAGMKQIVIDLIQHNMIDAIVATGANIVDQDFFEALGYQHYRASPTLDDEALRALAIDRIYDTLIDEDELRVCDNTICEIADSLPPAPYSSREFIEKMGAYLANRSCKTPSIVLEAFKHDLPIFVPAFNDCSAGFGLIMHQVNRPTQHVTIDSIRDFRELTQLKLKSPESGLLMVGGGVPKNFAQDIVVACELLGHDAPMHKYAVQITVADERDGALSGSTLKEACSWGKVSMVHEQMVFSEATIAFPLITGAAYHEFGWKNRQPKRLSQLLR